VTTDNAYSANCHFSRFSAKSATLNSFFLFEWELSNAYLQEINKMLSYRRETALQGVL